MPQITLTRCFKILFEDNYPKDIKNAENKQNGALAAEQKENSTVEIPIHGQSTEQRVNAFAMFGIQNSQQTNSETKEDEYTTSKIGLEEEDFFNNITK